jgi:hypothetical protein
LLKLKKISKDITDQRAYGNMVTHQLLRQLRKPPALYTCHKFPKGMIEDKNWTIQKEILEANLLFYTGIYQLSCYIEEAISHNFVQPSSFFGRNLILTLHNVFFNNNMKYSFTL